MKHQAIILALGTNCGLLKGKAGVPCPLTTCQACSVRVLIRCSYFHHYLSFPTFWGCSDNPPPRRQTLCMLTSPHRFPCFLPEPHNKNHGTCLHWAAAIAAQTHSSPSTVLCLHLRSYCSLHSCCLLSPHPTWLLVFLLYHLRYPGGLSRPLQDGWLISLYESNPSTTILCHAALNVLFSSEPLPATTANNLRAVTLSLWLLDPQWPVWDLM